MKRLRRRRKNLRFLALLLSLALVLTGQGIAVRADDVVAVLENPRIVVADSMSAGQKVTYDCVWFGSYPQREVVKLSGDCGASRMVFVTADDYIVDWNLYDRLQEASWDGNNDTVVDGEKYHRLKQEEATYSRSDLYSDNYFQWGNTNNYRYFRYDPIKWRVLESSGGSALLLADKALDDQKYHQTNTAITWEKSSIRSWLNGHFKSNAFTEEEQQVILTSSIENHNSLYNSGIDGGEDTKDSLFLLSETEAYKVSTYGFAASDNTNDEARRCKSSTYAKAMGMSACNSSYSWDQDNLGCGDWWLRSPGYFSNSAVKVSMTGSLFYYMNVDANGSCDFGIRPALRVNSRSSVWTYAGIVCTDGTVDEDAPPTYIPVTGDPTNPPTPTDPTDPETYTISYNANGGSGAPESQTKTEGTALTLSDTKPTRSGYTFLGWATDSSATSAAYSAGDSFTVDADTTLYAVWQKDPETYTISYDANGGSGAPESQIKTEGTALTLSDTKPTRSGYTFLGWATSSNAASAAYEAGDRFTTDADTTLYAVWEQDKTDYSIIFDANSGSGTPDTIIKAGTSTSVTMGDISNTIPTRSGYTFYGWSASPSWSTKRIAYSSSCGGTTASDGTTAATTKSSWTYADYCSYTGGSTSDNTLTLYAQWQKDPETYTIFYDANGGSGAPESQTKTEGTDLILSDTKPTRSGYTFLGWATDSNAASATYEAGDSFTVDADTTLYAVWQKDPETYTISYNANGGSGAPSSQTKTEGTDLTLSSTKPTRSGYTFLGWATDSSAATAVYEAGNRFTTDADTTLYAVWQKDPETYTISYNANGGSGAPESQTKTEGTALILSDTKPTRSGYTFLGWATDSNAATAAYSAGDSFTTDADTTLYAVWQKDPETYTIFYNANGGSGAPESQTKTEGTDLILSSTKPTRSGYTFLGWATDSSATSAAYEAGDRFTTDADTTLYAVWEQDKTDYSIIFDANNGTGSPDTITKSGTSTSVTMGDISNTKPTRQGYTFYGWSASPSWSTKRIAYSSSCGGTTASDGTTAATTKSSWTYADYCSYTGGSTSDNTLTLYAQWQKDPETYTIFYNANGGSGAPESQTKTEGTDLILSDTKPARSGYTFLGWATSSNAASAAYEAGDRFTTDADTTLYAVWQKDLETYTIFYDANGGSGEPSSQTKTEGTDLILSSTIPTRSGYTFLGWATDSNATTTAYEAGDRFTVDADTTLYAVWQKDPETYTISYNATGGSGAPESQTKTEGTDLILSDTKPTRSGYTFLGWATESSAATAAYSAGDSFTTDADTTLYAVWEQETIDYSIIFDANNGTGSPDTIIKAGTSTSVTMGDISNTIPTRPGYTFYGWSARPSWSTKRIAYSSSCGGTTASDGTTAATTKSSWTYADYCSYTGGSTSDNTLILYAQWQKDPETYTISYNANGGSGEPESQTKTEGTDLILSSTKPTRSGYTFLGWSTSSSAATAAYSAGDSFTTDADTTLYAVWQKDLETYTIFYDANGGSGEPSSQTKTEGTDLTLSSTKPTRSGYTFLGWATDSNATTAAYEAGDRFTVDADTTLYAVWKEEPDVESVTDGGFTYTLYDTGLCVINGSGKLDPGDAGDEIVKKAVSIKIEGATSIGDGAFEGCSSLTEITIPSSVTSIGEDAFKNIPNLVIKVDKGSYAEQYLKEQGIAYETVGDNNNDPTSDDTNTNPDTDKDTSNTHTHSVVSVDTVQATMTADGKTAGTKCSSCGAILSGCQVIPKIAVVKLSASAYKWNGKVKTPALTVKASDGTTIPATYYTVTKSSGRKNVGKYAYKVVFKGNYSGTKTLSFKINPKGTTQLKPAAIPKGFTAKWKKQATRMSSSRITGYQVRYSMKSNMTSSKIKTVSGYKKTSVTITKLKPGKKYYIQVRTYKIVNKVKYYSTWSAKKAVITK